MELHDTLIAIHESLSAGGVAHALIGGLALGAHGAPRATRDIDLLVDGGAREVARERLTGLGFIVRHESPEVIQFDGAVPVDALLANRAPTRAMLREAGEPRVLGVPTLGIEALIGLKLQAWSNDPARALREQADIQALARLKTDLDRDRIRGYADLFGLWDQVEPLL